MNGETFMTAWLQPPAGGPGEPGPPGAPAPGYAGSSGYPGEVRCDGEPGQAAAMPPPQKAGEGPAAVAGLYLASGLAASDVEPVAAVLPSLVPVATAMRGRESAT